MQPTITRPPLVKKRKSNVIKLMVVGLAKSGKTSFIQSVSQYTEWQDESRHSWFFGRVRVDEGTILHFLEPPMARRFNYVWLREAMINTNATGYIVLVDSTRPQDFGQFLSILYTLRGLYDHAPVVVAATKQDDQRAWGSEDIRLGLGIHDVPVLPCASGQYNSVRDVVLEVLYRIAEHNNLN